MTLLTRGCASFILLLQVLAVACSSSDSPASPASPAGTAPVRRIVVLGDSLAVSPSPDRSFPTELQARAQSAGLNASVTNAGISGDTSAGGVRRIDAVLDTTPHVLVLALGANDGLGGVDVTVVERNLGTIIERAQARNVSVLLCGMETPPRHGWQYSLAFHGIFPRLAAQYRVPLVPFLLAGVALNPDMNMSDGIHPNAAGARRIADTLWPFLQPMI
jgi:acyl-CoA thioesterase-1